MTACDPDRDPCLFAGAVAGLGPRDPPPVASTYWGRFFGDHVLPAGAKGTCCQGL